MLGSARPRRDGRRARRCRRGRRRRGGARDGRPPPGAAARPRPRRRLPARRRPRPRAHAARPASDGGPERRDAVHRPRTARRSTSPSPTATPPIPRLRRATPTSSPRCPTAASCSSLHVIIASPEQVTSSCGGLDGTLACYVAATRTMVDPGSPVGRRGLQRADRLLRGRGTSTATTSPPIGPTPRSRRWTSGRALGVLRAGLRAQPRGPARAGGRGDALRGQPGRGVGGHLRAPRVSRGGVAVHRAAAPGSGAYAAARQDVAAPWTHSRVRTLSGRFAAGGSSARHFTVTLDLDGALQRRAERARARPVRPRAAGLRRRARLHLGRGQRGPAVLLGGLPDDGDGAGAAHGQPPQRRGPVHAARALRGVTVARPGQATRRAPR